MKKSLLQRRKYDFLLAALFQHLFVGVVLTDLDFYSRVIWPINMVVLGLLSAGIFADRGVGHKLVKNALVAAVVLCPIAVVALGRTLHLMVFVSVVYIAFFVLLLVEVFRHLIRPSYINADLISASICGYLLLLEMGVFGMQALHYSLPDAFHGISNSLSPSAVYIDIVYFCSITLTSIGFGDITPTHHITKLATSILGILGQFYSVVLVGILIGKYTSSVGTKPVPDE